MSVDTRIYWHRQLGWSVGYSELIHTRYNKNGSIEHKTSERRDFWTRKWGRNRRFLSLRGSLGICLLQISPIWILQQVYLMNKWFPHGFCWGFFSKFRFLVEQKTSKGQNQWTPHVVGGEKILHRRSVCDASVWSPSVWGALVRRPPKNQTSSSLDTLKIDPTWDMLA